MTQPSHHGGGQAQPGSGQPPAANAQPLTPGAQPLTPGAEPLTPGAQPFGASAQPSAGAQFPAPAGAQFPAGALAPATAGARSSAAHGRGTARLRQFAWASVPVWSVGFLAFAPFLRLAVARRARKDWAIFVGYLLAVVLEIVAVSVGGQSGAGSTAAGGLVILLIGGGAVHSFVAFGSDPAPAAVSGAARPEELNREALATARGRMERRREAREIASKNPILCRELRIGRPDMAREYDDGGLVDVNQVPGEILQSQLGLSPDETAAVLAARAKLGRFSSADEVSAYAQLEPDRLDAIRDWMIFS